MFLKKVILFLFVYLALSSYAYADGITFSASVDKSKMALNEYLQYSLTVSGEDANLPEPQIAELADFNRYGTGKAQNISLINGKRSGRITYTHTLAPKTIGKFTIPPAKIEYDKKTYFTEPIEIEVTEAAKIQSAQVQQPQSAGRQPVSAPAGNVKGNVFVKASADKKNVYVNEKLTYKFSFYTNIDLVSNPEYYAPDFKGFWNDSSKPQNRYENIDGVNYLVNEIETTLYPIESGKITISPAKLKIAVMDFSSPSGNVDDFFSLFINMGQRREKLLESGEVTVNVLPLPKENVPADFKGAVGSFKISASLDKTEARTDEPVTLTVKVTGKGNMKSVNDIEFKPTKDFKVYDTVSSNVTADSKEFQILLLPLIPGEKTIEPLKLSFFDPAKKAYSFAQTQPLKIKVEGAAVINPENNTVNNSVGISKIQKDINYNKRIKNIKSSDGYFVKSPFLWIIFAPFVLFFIYALFFRFYIEKRNNDPSARLKSQADEFSRKCIVSAEGNIGKDKSHDFYENIYEGLLAAITAKTGILSDKMSISEIAVNLKNSGFDDEKIKNVQEILNMINFYRFASVQADEKSMKQLFEKTKEILNILRER
ncbi:MAG: BatD family protein [Endomicrobium sp.]|nr:BatD family protein [Endomicrobium sp.]